MCASCSVLTTAPHPHHKVRSSCLNSGERILRRDESSCRKPPHQLHRMHSQTMHACKAMAVVHLLFWCALIQPERRCMGQGCLGDGGGLWLLTSQCSFYTVQRRSWCRHLGQYILFWFRWGFEVWYSLRLILGLWLFSLSLVFTQ